MTAAPRPALIVVSGMPGAGKTTLAHRLAAAVGCPAICRDEIKEGMVRTIPEFTADQDDDLSRRTNTAFFGIIETLVRAGVTTVAEAAFQDRRAHADPAPAEAGAYLDRLRAFRRIGLPVPLIEADTTDGYRPALDELAAFATRP